MRLKILIVAALSLVGFALQAQERGDFMFGMNLSSAPLRIVEPAVEFFPLTSLSVEASAGYCFNRPTTTMRTVRERIKGGFANLGLRYYFFPEEKLRSFFGVGLYYGKFFRGRELELNHYYGTYYEASVITHSRVGWCMTLGLQYRHKWLVIQPALKYTVIGSRTDPLQFDYWTPGVGRAGLSQGFVRKRNFSFLPLLQVKIAI